MAKRNPSVRVGGEKTVILITIGTLKRMRADHKRSIAKLDKPITEQQRRLAKLSK